MKDFARARGRLRGLPLAARSVYTVFLAFTLAGLTLTAWLTQDMVGLDLSGTRAYYAGEGDAPAEVDAPQDGPLLDLPPESGLSADAEAMPLRKLLEVTHFHLFSMPVYLLILSHLFMLSRIGARSKALWIAIGTLSTAAHIAAPWAARSAAVGSVGLYAISGTGLFASFLVMSAVPLWEMWRNP